MLLIFDLLGHFSSLKLERIFSNEKILKPFSFSKKTQAKAHPVAWNALRFQSHGCMHIIEPCEGSQWSCGGSQWSCDGLQ